MNLLSLLYNYYRNIGTIYKYNFHLEISSEKKKRNRCVTHKDTRYVVSNSTNIFDVKIRAKEASAERTRVKREERTAKRETWKRKGASPSSARSGERRQVCISQRPAAKRETGIAAGVP